MPVLIMIEAREGVRHGLPCDAPNGREVVNISTLAGRLPHTYHGELIYRLNVSARHSLVPFSYRLVPTTIMDFLHDVSSTCVCQCILGLWQYLIILFTVRSQTVAQLPPRVRSLM